MKKKLLALAVAGALAAPLAAQAQNVQIYGLLQMSVDRVDNGDDTGTSMKDNSSRIGFRGSEDLGGGLKAIFQLESAVSPDELEGRWTGRDSWVGLASSTWGEIRVGSMFTAYKSSTDYADPFADTIGDYNNIVGSVGAGSAFRPFDARANNAIAYTSPTFGGFTVTATYGMNGEADGFESKGSDTVRSIAAVYKAGGLTLTAAYEDKQEYRATGFTRPTDNTKALKLSGGYKFGSTNVALLWAREDFGDDAAIATLGGHVVPAGDIRGSDRERDVIFASIKHSIGNIDLMASYTWADDVDDIKKSGADAFALGAVYNFSKRTNIGAYYAQVDNDRNARQGLASGGWNPAENGEKVKAFSVRVRHAF